VVDLTIARKSYKERTFVLLKESNSGMVALCLNGDPEKQSLGGLLKMPFADG